MADYDAGTAFVSIVPSFRNVQRSTARQARQWGRDVGREYQQGFEEEVERRPTLASGPSPERSRRQGEESGGSFADAFRKRLTAAAASLPPLKVGVAKSAAEQDLRDIRAELDALSDAQIGIDLDSAEALARLEQVQSRLRRLDSADADVQVRADALAAMAQLSAVTAAVEALDGRDVDVDINVRGGSAGLATLNSFSGRLVAIGLIAGSLAPALVPIGGIATAALVAIGAGATASLPAIGALALGLSGVGEAVGALAEQQANAAEEAQTAARAQQAAAFQVESAQAGLINARAQQASSARSSARAIEDATTRVGDVEERTARDVATAQRSARTAREEASRAAVDASRANAQAARALGDAERTAEAAQADALRTQRAITEARREATRDLEDLRSRVASGTLAEKDAELALAEARQAAARTAADPDADRLDQQRATLSVAQAEQRLGQVRRDNNRAQEDLNDAQRAGVDGARQVVAATEAAASADARRQQAGQAVADAEQAVVDTRLEGIRQVARADQAAAEREGAYNLARTDAVRARAEAQLALSDAQVAADEAQRSSTASVTAAQRGLAQAFLATETQASASAQKVADAFAGLSPAAAGFATFLFSLRGELDELRDSASSALLPGLTEAIEVLRPSLPAINAAVGAFAGALGDLAVAAAEALTGPAWEGFFAYMAAEGPGLFVDLARAVGGLALGLGNLMVAFAPLTDFVLDGLTRMMAGFGEWAGQLSGSDGFGAFLDYVRETAPQVGEFIGSLADAFVNIVRSMAPMGPVILAVVGAIFDFIAGLPPAVLQGIVTAVLGIVGALSLLSPLVPVIGGVVTAVVAGVPLISAIGGAIVAALGGPVAAIVTGIVVAVVGLGAALVAAWQHSETFRSVVMGALQAVGDAARWLWENAIKPAFDGIVAVGLYLWETVLRPLFEDMVVTFRQRIAPAALWLWQNVIKPAFEGISAAVSWAWDNVIKPAFAALVGFVRTILVPVITWLWQNIVKPAFAGIGFLVQAAWKVIEIALGALELFIKAVVAPVLTWLWRNVVQPAFEGIGSIVKTVWENVVRPALEALGGFIQDKVAPAFATGVDAIRKAWEAIQEVVKKPIEFIVNTIINKGIIGSFNAIAEKFDVDPIAPLTLPWAEGATPRTNARTAGGSSSRSTEFARGGVLPGRSSWQDGDDQLARVQGGPMVSLRRGEGIAISEAMEIGPLRGELMRWNQLGVSGGRKALRDYATANYGYAKGGFIQPAPGRITSPFGPRWGRMHSGVDWGTPSGTPVVAAADGVVSTAQYHSSWGNHVKLAHAGALASNYAHFSRDVVSPGQQVKQGQLIGYSGNTGNSTGPHLHFEIYSGGKRVNPVPWLDGGNAGAALAGEGSDPSAVTELLMKPLNAVKDLFKDAVMANPMGQLGAGMITSSLKGIAGWIGEKARTLVGLGTEGPGDYADYAGGGVERWRPVVLQALEILGLSPDLAGTTLRRMNQESSGNPRAINNWDINARNGIPSKGLMQVIDPTFQANAHPDHDQDIYDPLSNVLASMRYAIKRYGSLSRAYDRSGGYAMGGIAGEDTPTSIGGWPFHGLQLRDSGGPLEPGITAVLNATGRTEEVLTPAERAAWRGGAATQWPSHLPISGRLSFDDGFTAHLEGVADMRIAHADAQAAEGMYGRTAVG